jgi:hypothetical protein
MISIDQIKPYIESLNLKEKDKLIVQLLRKNQEEMSRIYYQKVASSGELDEYFDDTKEEILVCLDVNYSYGILQKNLAKGIAKANKTIKKYALVDKRPEKEAELLMFILDLLFEEYSNEFGTRWTAFDYRTGQTLSKLITLVSKKIHPDYRIEFEDRINNYLLEIKKLSSYNDFIYNLPDKLVFND